MREMPDSAADIEPDIVALIIARVIALVPGGLAPDVVQSVEVSIRQQYGGLRVRIPKRRKHLTAAEREELFRDGLSALSSEEIQQKHKISRATLFRQMKRGPGRFDE